MRYVFTSDDGALWYPEKSDETFRDVRGHPKGLKGGCCTGALINHKEFCTLHIFLLILSLGLQSNKKHDWSINLQ